MTTWNETYEFHGSIIMQYKCLINKSYSIFVNVIISPLLSVKIVQGVVLSALLSDFNVQQLHRAQMMQSASNKQF